MPAVAAAASVVAGPAAGASLVAGPAAGGMGSGVRAAFRLRRYSSRLTGLPLPASRACTPATADRRPAHGARHGHPFLPAHGRRPCHCPKRPRGITVTSRTSRSARTSTGPGHRRGGSVTTPPEQAAPGKAGAADSEPRVFRPGGVSYLRIPARDARQSAAFYQAVFGWTVRDDPVSPAFEDGTGHVIGHWRTDLPVAGEAGVLPYIYVNRVDDTLWQVDEHGGEVVRTPYPEGDLWVATFRDPAGNVLGVWQRGPRE